MDEARVGRGVEVGPDEEELDQPHGQPQGVDRHGFSVLAAQERGHEPLLGGNAHDLGQHEEPGQQSPHQGDDESQGDELRSPWTDRRLKHSRQGGVAQPGELGAGNDAVGQNIDGEQKGQNGKEAQDRRLADIGTRSGPLGEHRRPFNTDEHPHRHQHHVLDLGNHGTRPRTDTGSPEIVGEDIELESEQADENEDDQR